MKRFLSKSQRISELKEEKVTENFLALISLSHPSSVSLSSGVSRVNGDRRSYPLRAQPSSHHSPHPRRVRVSGAGVQWTDCHLHLPADAGAVEPGCRAAGSLFHRHRPGLHLALCGRLLRQ